MMTNLLSKLKSLFKGKATHTQTTVQVANTIININMIIHINQVVITLEQAITEYLVVDATDALFYYTHIIS